MSAVTTQVQFCQLAQDATETHKPIGSWFELLYLNESNWESVSDEAYERVNAMEDFVTHKLCEAIGLPQRRTAYSNDELAQAVSPEQQVSIWRDMLAKFGEPEDCTTDCPECGKPDGTPRYKGLCWRCKLGELADLL